MCFRCSRKRGGVINLISWRVFNLVDFLWCSAVRSNPCQ